MLFFSVGERSPLKNQHTTYEAEASGYTNRRSEKSIINIQYMWPKLADRQIAEA